MCLWRTGRTFLKAYVVCTQNSRWWDSSLRGVAVKALSCLLQINAEWMTFCKTVVVTNRTPCRTLCIIYHVANEAWYDINALNELYLFVRTQDTHSCSDNKLDTHYSRIIGGDEIHQNGQCLRELWLCMSATMYNIATAYVIRRKYICISLPV